MGDGMLSLSWNNHSSTFCHMLSMLRGTERYTDVTVACEGKFYEVHKLVLASCSDYFLKMFEKTPCKHPIVVLKDIHGKDIEALLSYMYDGIVSVAQNDLARLINAAEVLQIKGLAVPDEPPTSGRKAGNVRSASIEKSSPQPKRQRRDDNHGAIRRQRSRESSPPSAVRSDSELLINKQSGVEYLNPDRNRNEPDMRQALDKSSKSDNSETRDHKREKQKIRESVEPQIKVLDESEIKEETENITESDYDCIALEENSNMENLVPEGQQNQGMNLGFNSPNDQSFDSQAGPSGLQAWAGIQEGDLSNQSYPGDLSLDASVAGQAGSHSQQPQHLISSDTTVKQPSTVTDSFKRSYESSLNAILSSRRAPCNPADVSGEVYRCKSCPFTTSKHPDLLAHACLKIDRKKFTCPYCNYSTYLKGNLNVHIRSHTGEKPYACPYCPYRAAHKSNLKMHFRSHLSDNSNM